jgi:3-hydroxybutyryl-CoA dehydratase
MIFYVRMSISQEISFRAPVHIEDTITAHVEVVQVISEKNRIRLKTFCVIQVQTTVLDGEAIVSPP